MDYTPEVLPLPYNVPATSRLPVSGRGGQALFMRLPRRPEHSRWTPRGDLCFFELIPCSLLPGGSFQYLVKPVNCFPIAMDVFANLKNQDSSFFYRFRRSVHLNEPYDRVEADVMQATYCAPVARSEISFRTRSCSLINVSPTTCLFISS